MRAAVVAVALLLASVSPVLAQVRVLIPPSDMAKDLRSQFGEGSMISAIPEKEVKRQLERLHLDADELSAAQWRQLASLMEADYIFQASNGSVTVYDGRGRAVLDTDGRVPAEALRQYHLDLLFCEDYSQSGQHADAIRNCTEAAETFPESVTAKESLGSALRRAGRCSEAVGILEDAALGVEGPGSIDIELAQARECAGDTGGALEAGLAFTSPEDSAAIARTLGLAPSSIKSEYDRFDDETAYHTPWYIAKLDPDLRYRAQMVCSGSERCASSSVILLFTSQSGDWEFLRDRRLVILADDSRIEIEELDWVGDVEGPGVSEVLGGVLTVPQARAIASAEKAEARLGGHEFAIGLGAQQGVRELIGEDR